MKKFFSFVCALAFMCLAWSALVYAEAVKSPDIRSLYRLESEYIEKTDMNIGLDFVDAMQVQLRWSAYDEREVIDAEVEFPVVPEDLAMLILTDGVNIAQGQWDLTSGHSMHVYFYRDDLEQFVEKEVIYLVMIGFRDGLYFNVY